GRYAQPRAPVVLSTGIYSTVICRLGGILRALCQPAVQACGGRIHRLAHKPGNTLPDYYAAARRPQDPHFAAAGRFSLGSASPRRDLIGGPERDTKNRPSHCRKMRNKIETCF